MAEDELNIYPYLKQLADEVIEVAQRNLGAYRTVKTADGKRRKRRAVATGNLKDNLTNFDGRSMKLFEDTTFLGISVNNSSAQPATGDLTITLVVNSVDSALVLTIPAGSAAGDYTVTGSVAVSAGDNVAWKYSNGASTTSAIIQVCYAVITIP